jgi:hypothetical protein
LKHDQQQKRISAIVTEIASLHQRVERTIEALHTKLNEVGDSLDESNLYGSPDYWRLAAFRDGMIKIRLMIEQNFNFIETFGILATSRYVLELLIWLRLLNSGDPMYCFTYVKQLLNDKRDHAKEHLAKVKREIELFHKLEERELGDTVDQAHRSISTSSSDFSKSFGEIAAEIDRTARRQFCLYADDAKTRGYGYQAALMEKQAIPQLEREIEQLERIKAAAISQLPTSAQGHKKWWWKEQAAAAGMTEQFEFVYAYTSRLLHATPTSMTTDQKNLELNEVIMFLDFVYVSMLDALEMSELICDGSTRH